MFPRREALSLHGAWEFIPDPERTLAPDRLPRGRPITVPGAWEAHLPDPYGIVHAWYRRKVAIPAGWRDGRLILRFGSAMARAAVWLDGRLVGANEDGYLPFEIDAGAPQPGTERELVVGVENPVNAYSDYPAFSAEAMQAATDRLGGRSFDGLPRGKQTWYRARAVCLGRWSPSSRQIPGSWPCLSSPTSARPEPSSAGGLLGRRHLGAERSA